MNSFFHKKMLPHFHKINFKAAAEGIIYALKTQPNFIIHGGFATAALVLCSALPITRSEFVTIILVIGMVFVAEMINTAIESAVDLVTDEWKELAKHAKDVAAGAVLIAAITSVVIGVSIFYPHLVELLMR